MNRDERGQGLVEYSLILVLVAYAVLLLLHLVGDTYGGLFCELVLALTGGQIPEHVESMDIDDESVTIDVRGSMPESVGCSEWERFGDLDTLPSHGTVDNHYDGTFIYQRNEVISGTDDSFTFSWSYACQDKTHVGLVTIIVGEPDPGSSVASIISSAEPASPEWDAAREKIIVLWEAAEAQEEGLQEGVDLVVEAVGESLEVLLDFADDHGDPGLSESLSQLLQQVKAGNLDAVPDVIDSLLDELAELPLEVGTAMSLKVAPRVIQSCEVVSAGSVSPEAIAAAVLAVEDLDDDHPGKAEALQLLQGAAETMEGRNDAIGSYLDAGSLVLDAIIAGLEYAGEWDLAAEIAAASAACGN
jgi:Flp pilus assembly pilin Flp